MSVSKDTNCIIEFRQTDGKFIKVSAIDPITGTEVSIVGDPKVSQDELMQLAAQKLAYVLQKKQKTSTDDSTLI